MTEMNNQSLAEIFRRIANLLEIKGEVIYKILAYRKAADSLEALGQDIHTVWQEGRLTEIEGVGKAIAEKIDELLSTGKLGFLERLEEEVPPSLVDLLLVPDIGPKKVAMFWRALGITSLAELESAARSGKLRKLPGMGEKSENRIIAGIESLARRSTRIPIGRAWPFAQELLGFLRSIPDVKAVELGGSLRRMRSMVGDVDIVAAAKRSEEVVAAFTGRQDVARVLSQGETKASVEFTHGIRAQLWVHPPERWGTALQYATGSKDHNVRLRELALKQGLSLSEHALSRADGSEIICDQEEQVYHTLGLPWIPPELREDRGEVQAALENQLPALIELGDIKAELHSHTTWSDGKLSVRDLALAARERGLNVLAISDHTHSLGVVRGMTPENMRQQRQEIAQVQSELGDTIRLLQGVEVEILADGELDYPDDVLAEMDIVTASLHSSLRQPREKITERLLRAVRNPHIDIIGHPTGRLLPNREGADLDMDAILKAAAESGVALEINAHPARLDLEDIYVRRAISMGIRLAINTDAHSQDDLGLLHFGVATARRGWAEAHDVINTWSADALLEWCRARG
jgi:DNA polymerase (family 10)